MLLKDTTQKFGAISKFFHWTIAVLVICQFYWIFMREYILQPESETSIRYMVNYHKPTGFIILILALFAITWRLINIKPTYPITMPGWEKLAAKTIHFLLYVSIIIMPLSGLLMSIFAGKSINIYNLFIIPALATPNKVLAGIFHETHHILAIFIFILIVIHILAAFKHHFFEKDNILKRMLPFY